VVRDVVATVSGVRVLVVTSDKKQRAQRLELDNQGGKTVARVELDEPVSVSPVRPAARRFAWLRRMSAGGPA
jgi:hypothetical protein